MGGLLGRGRKMSKGRKGDGRINREARQHVRCLNPRRARCSGSLSPPRLSSTLTVS